MNKKYTLKYFQDLAASKQGRCLSGVYTNMKTQMTWECHKGHQWEACSSSVLYQKSWCPKCRNENSSIRQLGSIENLHLIAQMKDGKCLSDSYLGVRTPVEWQCNKMHRWNARPSDIKRGSWCPVCAKVLIAQEKRKYSLDDIKKLATAKDGQCLSKTYKNTSDKIKLQCKNNHIWTTNAQKLILGNWCKICASNNGRVTVKGVNDKLKFNDNIKCLDVIHRNKITKIELMCSNKHIWISDLSAARNNGGCPTCSKRKKYTIEDMQCLASKNEGKCLSKKYVNNFTHLQWQCANNHKWYSAPRNIIKGSWCPTCSCLYGVNEEKCRFIFGSLLNLDFPKDNQVVKPLELDGYNSHLKLAFEYNGELHYRFVPGLHKTIDKFLNQKKRDKHKKFLCKHKHIKLVVIPYTRAQSDKGLISFIYHKVTVLFPGMSLSKVNMQNFNYIPSTLKLLNKIAMLRGGKCLSDVYMNNKSPLIWKCQNGHIWKTSASTIKRGCWCPACAINKKKKPPNTQPEIQA